MVETHEPSLRSHEHLALIANTVPALISYLDTDCRYQFCNAAYEDWFGLRQDQLIGHHVCEVLGPEACETLLPRVQAALAGETQEFEIEAKYAYGPRRWIHAVYRPHHDDAGHVVGLVIMVLDINGRKQAEAALLRNQQLIERALSIETVGILFFDLRGHITHANAAFERMSGYTCEELRRLDWHVLTAPEFFEPTARTSHNIATAGETPPYEKQMIRKDDSRWWGLFAPTRLSGTGEDSYCIEFILDITGPKRHEEQLFQQARLIDLSTDAIISREAAGRVVSWNTGAEKLYGWTRDEAVGKNLHQLLQTKWPEPFENITHKLDADGTWTGELAHTTRSGEKRIVLCRKVLNRSAERTLILETNTDITARKAAEAAIRDREAVLRSVAREARVGLVMVDKNHRYIFANHRHAEILGVSNGDVEGKRAQDVLGDLYQEVKPNLDRAFAGERVTYEIRIPPRQGTDTEHFAEIVYEPRLHDPENPYVVIVMSDVTERKLMQQHLERLVADRTTELRETNEHLEAFVYSIAHDLRGPLRAMQGYSQILMDTANDPLPEADRKKFLEKINRSAEFMDKMVLDLLAFGRTASTEISFGPVDLQSVWDAAVEQSAGEIERANAFIEVTKPLCTVRAHAPTLTQILANLLSNAVKFVEPGMRPHVKFGCELKGSVACIWMQDNGVGIDPEYHERIFRVFERLHGARFAGTGIGLAIVRKGVERMNGHIGVESAAGRGTRFWIELPKV